MDFGGFPKQISTSLQLPLPDLDLRLDLPNPRCQDPPTPRWSTLDHTDQNWICHSTFFVPMVYTTHGIPWYLQYPNSWMLHSSVQSGHNLGREHD